MWESLEEAKNVGISTSRCKSKSFFSLSDSFFSCYLRSQTDLWKVKAYKSFIDVFMELIP